MQKGVVKIVIENLYGIKYVLVSMMFIYLTLFSVICMELAMVAPKEFYHFTL